MVLNNRYGAGFFVSSRLVSPIRFECIMSDGRIGAYAALSGGACPAGSTPEGDQCKCNAGTFEVGNTCEAPDDRTPDRVCEVEGMLWNSTLNSDSTGRVTGKVSPDQGFEDAVVCRDRGSPTGPKGCKHLFTPDISFRMGNKETDPWATNGHASAMTNKGAARAKGALACDPAEIPTDGTEPLKEEKKQPDNCRTGYKGQVNGVDVCIKASAGEHNTVDKKQTDDGQGNKTITKSDIKCNGNHCEVTEQKETKKSDGTSTTTTTTHTTDRGQYCAQNPKSGICRFAEDKTGDSKGQGGQGGGGGGGGGGGDGDGEPSEFGGACEAGFTCSGDAIQCAIAKEQHVRACRLFDKETPESILYEENKGKEGNQTEDLEGNDTVDLNNKIDQTDILGGGAGVSDLTVVVAGSTVVLPFSLLNTSLGYLGQLLVAVSMLVAFRIVGRG